MGYPVQGTMLSPNGRGGLDMNTTQTEIGGFQEILERRAAELIQVLQRRDGIAIEKSPEQMDEIQYATQRELAIRNVDRESSLLRDVKEALGRIRDGSFGSCTECESAISPRRLAAVPWASRCIQCQEAADRDRLEGTERLRGTLLNAA
jgi:DnaK suppressor protein